MQRPRVGHLARALALAAALSLALASCARQHDRVHDSGAGGDDQFSEEYFAHPLGPAGVEVSTLGGQTLSYEPLAPFSPNSSPSIFVANPNGEPLADMVAFVFDDSLRGRYVVLEFPDDATTEGLRQEAAEAPSPGCQVTQIVTDDSGVQHELSTCTDGTETTTTLAGGQTALVTQSPKGTGVIWVEKLVPAAGLDTELVGYNMTIEVIGPAPDFTLEAAIAAANEFAISSKRVAQSG